VLVRSLRLDFVFVRLSDPRGLAAVEVTRGNGWYGFQQWLQRHLAENGGLAHREIITDTGGNARPVRGIVVPIGVNTEGGLVAAASHRADFPGDIEQLLLSVAANHAATALNNARLIEERRRAEETLQEARNDLELKVAERTAELRRTTAELETILDASPVGIALLGSDQAVQRCNSAYERIVGWNADEIVGHPIPIAPHYQKQWSMLAETLKRGAVFANFEIRLRRKDGSDFDASIAFAPFGGEPGRPAGFVGAVENISDRKRAQEALRRSEAYLAEAQCLSHTGSWVWNVATRETVHWSAEHYRLFGFDPAQGIPPFEAWLERVYPEDRAAIVEAIAKVTENADIEVHYRLLLPDGAVKFIRTIGRQTLNASGQPSLFVGTSIDVTERKEAEDERERLLAEAVAAQLRFRDLVNAIEGIVWEADPFTLRFSFVSEQAERIVGYPLERWLCEPTFWRDHLHPADRDWAVRFCLEATAAGRNHDFEYRFVAADGRIVWMRELVSVTVRDGRPAQLRGVMMDITRQKQTEDAVRKAQADLAYMSRVTTMGELTASLAHEIKQPIAAAATNAGACARWLTKEAPDIREARDAATRTANDLVRATEIINRIRSLFQKEATQREWVDINQLISEIVVLLRDEAIRHAVSIHTRLASGLPRVAVDRVQLQQVLMNLMINGIEAMKAVECHRELTLSSERTGADQLLVSVSDTGLGLPPEGDQIFKAFFTTKPEGTGMGLAISRSIIESHGGHLWAVPSDVGARFHFTLPMPSPGVGADRPSGGQLPS
jgi:PAS domain S-box-containing protein